MLFFGFEETWRWRFRADEDRFNQFWTQVVRALARTRITKVELKTDRQTQLVDITVGQPVELEVDAYGGAAIEGVVESISAATGARFTLLPPDNASGNFTKVVQRVPVRIRITKGLDAARPLRIGLSVVAHVSTK